MRHSPNLNRCAFGALIQPAVAAQFGFVSLFNDSSAAQVIAVRDYGVEFNANAVVDGFLVQKGQLGSNITQGQAIYTSQGTLPGQLSSGSVAALPNFNFLTSGATNSLAWFHDYPMFVLAPGWSITGYGNIVNGIFAMSFWWEWMYPAQLIDPDIGPEHIRHDRGY